MSASKAKKAKLGGKAPVGGGTFDPFVPRVSVLPSVVGKPCKV